MRDIKFRSWKHKYTTIGSSDTGEMVYDIRIGNSIWNNEDIEVNRILKDIPKLMQYTGLKDENGVEIYEGDILLTAGIVTWNNEDARWSCIDIEWNNKRELHDMLWVTTPLEVIGNIYENKELLEQ